MAGEEYKRRLDIHRKKLGFGQELVDIVSSELKAWQGSDATVAKMAEKIGKVDATRQELKLAVMEKRREVEEEIRSEFVSVAGLEGGEPDTTIVEREIRSVGQQVTEKEKNCGKLMREREHLDHDRKYHKVLKGIAAINFDKNSTETHMKGYITRPNGELHVFEFDLEEGDICTVADSLWDNL